MMMAPFYMLTGRIDLVREIVLRDGRLERHFRDETGRQAVVIADPKKFLR